MVVLSFNNLDEATTYLAKTAVAARGQTVLTKQADVAQILQYLKAHALVAGPLIGAGAGALFGGLSSLGRDEEERNPLQSMLTGAMGGGLLGLGVGAGFKYGPGLYEKHVKGQTPSTKNPYSEATSPEAVRGIELFRNIHAGNLDQAALDRLHPVQWKDLNDWANSAEGKKQIAVWDANNVKPGKSNWLQSWIPRAAGEVPQYTVPEGIKGVVDGGSALLETGAENRYYRQQNQILEDAPTATSGAVTGGLAGAGAVGADELIHRSFTQKKLREGIIANPKSYESLESLSGNNVAASKALRAAKATRPGLLPGLGRYDPTSWFQSGVGDITIPKKPPDMPKSNPAYTQGLGAYQTEAAGVGTRRVPAARILSAAEDAAHLRPRMLGLKTRIGIPIVAGLAGGFLNSWRRNNAMYTPAAPSVGSQ